MKLKKLTEKIKDAYYNSFVYYFYNSRILSVPLLKIFIKVEALSDKIKESYILSFLFSLCEKLLAHVPFTNISINGFHILGIIFISAFVPTAAQVLILCLSAGFILKSKASYFFASGILFLVFFLFMYFYGAERAAYIAFVLWCCGSAYYLSFKVLKVHQKQYILKFLYYFNLIFCLLSRVTSEKIILYLLPFSMSYIMRTYTGAKRISIFSFIILISVFFASKVSGIILSSIALEIVIFCIIFKPKYIFTVIICAPVAISALISRILLIRQEILSAGLSFSNIVIAGYKIINKGFKGDIRLLSREVYLSAFNRFVGISAGERFFVYAVLLIALLTAYFLGRYILKLMKKTLFLLKNSDKNTKPVVSGAICFLAGTSFASLMSVSTGNIGTMLIYWILLGFIRTLHS